MKRTNFLIALFLGVICLGNAAEQPLIELTDAQFEGLVEKYNTANPFFSSKTTRTLPPLLSFILKGQQQTWTYNDLTLIEYTINRQWSLMQDIVYYRQYFLFINFDDHIELWERKERRLSPHGSELPDYYKLLKKF